MNTVQERPAVPAVPAVSAADAAEQTAIDLQATREVPDWERLIEAGIVPALALGAERRMRR